MEPTKGLALDIKLARESVIELSKKYGLDINPDEKNENISVGMQRKS